MDFEKSVDFEKFLILKKCGFHILIQNLRVSAAGVALPPPHDSVNLSHRCLKGKLCNADKYLSLSFKERVQKPFLSVKGVGGTFYLPTFSGNVDLGF